MHLLGNFWYLARVSPSFLKLFASHHWLPKSFTKENRFWKEVHDHIPELANLNQPLLKRMRHYVFANSITAYWFSSLRGKGLSNQEQKAGIILGIATPVADYLIDHEQVSYDQVEGMLHGADTHPLSTVVRGLHELCRLHHPQLDLFDDLFEKTQRAQEASRRQQSELSLADHERIMSDKGGYALLLYRSALANHCSDAETRMIFSLGALMQLHNDIFDVYRDVQEGIHTIASSGITIAALRSIYQKHVQRTYALIAELAYPKKNRKSFLLLLNLVVETGFIALEQYEALQDPNTIFQPSRWKRKDLVIDMDNQTRIKTVVLNTLNKTFPLVL